jgi:hypothetical protein
VTHHEDVFPIQEALGSKQHKYLIPDDESWILWGMNSAEGRPRIEKTYL